MLVLLGLLVGADRIAEQVAEGAVADRLSAELAGTPRVEIGGFPFLTQALSGRYRSLTVTGAGVTGQAVPLSGLTAELSGVRLPLSDVVTGRVDSVPVERLSGRALIAYDAVEAAADRPGLRLSAQGDRLRVTGEVRALGRTVRASALADVTVDGGALSVTARDYEVAGREVDAALRRLLGGRLDVDVPLPALPYGLRVTAVTVTPDGLVVRAEARDVLLRRGGATAGSAR